MMSELAQKTAHLKWLKAIRASSTLAAPPTPSPTCDCKAWLKRQTRQQTVPKPRLPEIKPLELVLLAAAAPKSARQADYNRRFEQGAAGWYHIPASSLQDYTDEQIRSIAYAAIGITQTGVAERRAPFLYAVASVQKLPRHMLTVEQSGHLVASDAEYWLFELSHSVVLAQPIRDYPQSFAVKLSVATELLEQTCFADMTDVKA